MAKGIDRIIKFDGYVHVMIRDGDGRFIKGVLNAIEMDVLRALSASIGVDYIALRGYTARTLNFVSGEREFITVAFALNITRRNSSPWYELQLRVERLDREKQSYAVAAVIDAEGEVSPRTLRRARNIVEELLNSAASVITRR